MNTETLTQQQEADAVRNIALRKMDELETLKAKKKTAKEMLDAELEADREYAEALELVKQAKERLKKAKAKALAMERTAQLDSKVKDIAAECREVKKDISVFLVQYNELTGKKTIENAYGEEIDIIKSAKAKRKKK